MRILAAVMTAMLLMLSGCAAQTDSPADGQLMPVQAEREVSVDISEEEPQRTEAADTSEETAPNAETQAAEETASIEEKSPEAENAGLEDTMRLLIGETEVPVTWEENASVEALRELCPVTIQMSMYGGFEQVGPIGQSIVRDDVQTDTSCGDIVLYSGNQIVIFYGSNSWSYTRLGHISLPQTEMSELLSNGDVAITLE